MKKQVGISAIGLAIPSLTLRAEDLATINGVDPAKYIDGLGIRRMALCSPEENTSTLAIAAASDALKAWGEDPSKIGLLAIGTESGDDYSKPLTQAVCRSLELNGAIRSYEVKHACLGATLVIRQAVEWLLSGAANGQSALVIAADTCQYAPNSDSEPTQGAGAVAFIIGEPVIASIMPNTYSYSLPVDDFMRPVNERFPIVNASLSHRSYLNAARSVFNRWSSSENAVDLSKMDAMSFHCPFPKMVKKTVTKVLVNFNYDQDGSKQFYDKKVGTHLAWNRQIGNSYNASLWFSVSHALANANVNGLISAFSYGSGSGAELMFLQANKDFQPYWAKKIETDLKNSTILSPQEYVSLRKNHG